MDEWPTASLGDVAELLTGFPFKSERYTSDPSAPRLLRGDNVAQGVLRWDGVKRWPADDAADFEQYRLREDDVILAMDRPWIDAGLKYAAVRESDLPALLVQRVARLRGTETLDTGFLKYVIASRAFTEYVLAVQTGTAVPHISGGQIKRFEFRLPSLTEQRAIAHILGTLDDKIELNRRMNETLEQIARALFKSWFVDFDPVRAKSEGRDPGLPSEIADLFPDSFEESELGEIPKGWEVRACIDVAEIMIGGDWGKDERSEKNRVLTRCLRGVDLHNLRLNGWSDAPTRFISEASFQKRAPSSCDVLIEGSGECGRSLAFCESVSATFDEPVVYSNFCKRIRTQSLTHALFVERLLNGMVRSGDMKSFVTGTAMPNLDLKGLMTGSRFVLPSMAVLDVFGRLTAQGRHRLFSREPRTLAALRDTLLPKLISGELRVTGADALVAEAT